MFSFEFVLFSLFLAELFFLIRSKYIYFFFTSGKGYRSSVIECSGKLLLPTAYLVFVELDVSV